jgi:hypothetical protein
MTHIATHIRIFNVNPSDELVEKRTAAVGEIAKIMGAQRNVDELLRYGNDLAIAVQQGGSLSQSLTGMIEGAIRNSSTAFVANNDTKLEMLVCALAGATQVLAKATPTQNGSTSIADVLSYGLWSALSFQKPRTEAKLESLRSELMEAAQRQCMRAANEGRKRVQVADPEFKHTAKKEDKTPAEIDAEAINQGLQPFRAAIANLRANAAIDREEIDLLWWVMSDWSTLLRRRFSTENGAVAAVASGIEAGRLVRRIPAEAHRHLVQRNVPASKDLSLQDLVNAIGDDRAALVPTEGQTYISQCPVVFPLSSALTTGSANDAKAKIRRSISDWADRALLESAIAHMCSNLPIVSV